MSAATTTTTTTRTTTTSMGYPFTHAQWKELETQAMIYKYMVASLPVPPDLLIPIIRSLSQTQSPHHPYYPFGGGLTLGYGIRTDGEPGRCKRTDGKKWRCAREVAPHQKYCDRHLHRGRPRSRKLVEAQANGCVSGGNTSGAKKTRGNVAGFPASVTTGSVSFSGGEALAPREDGVPLIFPRDDDNSSFLTLEPFYKESRDMDWLMIGDPSTSAYNSFAASSYLEPTDYTKGQAHHSFFGSDPLALSSLTLSMSMNGGANDGEMGLSSVDSSSWVPLTPLGGPLAEALGHGITSTPSNPSSPSIAGNGNDEMGSSITARALSSLSSSSGPSGPSSPTLGTSPFSRSEFTVQWYNPPNNLASFAN